MTSAQATSPRALVTGATGFVGSNLVQQLRQLDWQVRCLVRDPTRAAPLEQLGATSYAGNLSDADAIAQAMADVDYVFHVAGRVRALKEEQFQTDNVEGTRNIITAAAEQSQPPVTVLISSLAAGGPSRPGRPRQESDPDQPISAYGKSKLSAERAAGQLADEVPISIIRPPIIFGPADPASLAIFRGIQLFRLHPVPGFRRFPVSLVHVEDLCAALVKIAQGGTRLTPTTNGAPHTDEGIYYIAAERTVPYGHLGKLAGQSLNRTGIILPLPKALFWILGGALEIFGQLRRRPAVLNLDKIREATAQGWECSDQKIRQELGYQPAASLEQRFIETANWYRDQGWL